MSLKWTLSTLLLVVIVSVCFFGCESDDLPEPLPNIRPETYISEVSPGVNTRISWYGTDVDGRAESFEYRWDDGDWVTTSDLSENFPSDDVTNPYADFGFTDLDDQHTFYVRAIDNNDQADLSPASAVMSPRTTVPETQITEGPMTGDVVGPDVRFAWLGVDADGSIEGFEYALDDLNSWTTVEEYITENTFYGLGEGAHTFYVRAVDDLGAVDASPAQSAFVVASGFKPQLNNTSPVSDGGGWFSGVDLALSWEASVEYYQGVLPTGAFCYALDDSTGYDATTAPLASGWLPNSSYTIPGTDISEGAHTFYIKAKDVSGNVDLLSISFSAAPFNPTNDLLLLDNFSWVPNSYADQDAINQAIADGFLHGVTFDTRDVDDEGAGILTPGLLGQYKAVVVVTDGGYSAADYGNLFAAYATAGGNLMLSGYYLVDFGAETIMEPFGLYGAIYGSGEYLSLGLTGVASGTDGSMIQTDDLYIPVPTADSPRICERIYTDQDNTEEIFYNDVDPSDAYGASRVTVALASMNSGGNYVVIAGQSLPFMDQTAADTQTFGNRLMALWGVTDTDN